MLHVYIDGACEPINPGGVASYGLLVKEGPSTIYRASGILGKGPKMSNNVAEYSALIAFLEWWREKGENRPATIYSDSQLLINQLTGKWAVHGGLYLAYYEKATMMMAMWKPQLTFIWIPREQNLEADILSKQALLSAGIKVSERDGKSSFRYHF